MPLRTDHDVAEYAADRMERKSDEFDGACEPLWTNRLLVQNWFNDLYVRQLVKNGLMQWLG